MERDTVALYEARAVDWEARRRAETWRAGAAAVGAAAPPGVRADLGCGPGFHTTALGAPVLALDAAFAMVERVTTRAPHAWPIQADLEALPVRTGALAAAWARASYLHVPRVRLPLALADLHRSSRVGAPIGIVAARGDGESVRTDGDFPGRFFAHWQPDALGDVLTGAGLDLEEVTADDEWVVATARRARTLADTVGPRMRVLVCGLNPSLHAADAGVGFARPGNRFWPAACAAGLVARDRDARHALVAHDIGMTDIVKRATPRAADLRAAEYRAGLERVQRLVEWLRPGAVCFVGLAGWRAAVDRRAGPGVQPALFGGRPAYVMPSTSGANARTSLPELVAHLRSAAALAP